MLQTVDVIQICLNPHSHTKIMKPFAFAKSQNFSSTLIPPVYVELDFTDSTWVGKDLNNV